MNKRKKTKAKSKAKGKTQRKINYKLLILIITALVIITSITTAIFVIRKRINDRRVNVAFYGLPEEYSDFIRKRAPELDNVDFVFDIISDDSADVEKLTKSYDMIFTWKGEVTDSLAEFSHAVPNKILSKIPRSLRDEKCMPLLLDHFEMNYSTSIVKSINYNIDSGFDGFLYFLKESKKSVFSPFFCSAADDRMLLAFTGSLVESFGGLDAYKEFLAALKKENDFNQLLERPLDSNGLTLHSVLDFLKSLPENGMSHPQWYNGKDSDMLIFMETGNISAFYTTLSKHRKIPFEFITQFETNRFPIKNMNVRHATIAPALSCMLISDNSNCEKYLEALIDIDTQRDFSGQTMLAPVHYQAECYDGQADDVRFFAASNPSVLPDPALAVFQRNGDAVKKLASEIRNYLGSY